MKLLVILCVGIIIGIIGMTKAPSLYVYTPSLGTTVSRTPTPTPNAIQVVHAIVDEFAPEGKYVVKQALEVSFCESGWRFEARNYNTNKTTDYNVFQINSVHMKRYGKKFTNDLSENVRVAHEIYKQSGWNAWVCAHKLSYAQ